MAGPAAAQPSDPIEDTGALDKRLKSYWDPAARAQKATVNPIFGLEGGHELTLTIGAIPNDPFYSYYPVGLRYTYWFSDDFGLELNGSYALRVNSELTDFLETLLTGSTLVNIPQSLAWMAGVDLIWAPIHGKLGIFASKISHFDIYFAIGADVIGTEKRTNAGETAQVDVGGNIGIGMRWFFTEAVALRFDYRQHFYPAEGDALFHPAELSLGVSFLLN